jgi:2-keto-myo-inositol isomerase
MQSCLNGATTMPYSLQRDIEAAAQAGFEAVELWGAKFDDYFAAHTVVELDEMLRGGGLAPAAIDFVGVDLNGPEPLAAAQEALEHYGEVANAIGCDLLLLVVGGRRPELTKAQTLNFLAKLMLPLCDAARRRGLRLALEPLGMDPIVPGPLEALEIIETSKQSNLGISWDFFHFWKSGVPLADIRRIPRERLYLVHADDAPDRDPATLTDADRVWPGEGAMPLDDYFGILRDLRYDGPVSVEVFNRVYWQMDPGTIAQEAFESLEEYL